MQVAVSYNQVRGAAVLNDRLANDVRRNGMHSSGTDDDRVLRALVRNEMCWFRYCGMTSAESLSQHGQLTVDALFNRQPVQRLKQRVDV